MNLLTIGDGSTYIDRDKAEQFDVGGITYYNYGQGVWVRQEGEHPPLGRLVPEREAFRQFMNAGKFSEAERNFNKLYLDGEVKGIVESDSSSTGETVHRHLIRFTIGGLVGLSIIVYVVLVTTGIISANHQISIADLGIIVIGAAVIGTLIRPQWVLYVQRLQLGGVTFELRDQLQGLEKAQKDQNKELEELRFALELIVTPAERKHLEHLRKGSPSLYERNDSVQAELRRLRAIGLISSKRYIFEMPDKFNLAEWVELTDRGNEYLNHWKELGDQPNWSTQENRTD